MKALRDEFKLKRFDTKGALATRYALYVAEKKFRLRQIEHALCGLSDPRPNGMFVRHWLKIQYEKAKGKYEDKATAFGGWCPEESPQSLKLYQ